MTTNQQLHQAARHLVVAEALRIGLNAHLEGSQSYVLLGDRKAQVQAASKGAWQIDDVDKYTTATIEVVALVDFTEGRRDIYLCPGDELRRMVAALHEEFLERHGGVRPVNPESKHAAFGPGEVRRWHGNWSLVR